MIPIREENFGHDPSELAFPGVSSCMTVTVVLADGTLIGTHLSYATPKWKVDMLFRELSELIAGRQVTAIVLAGRAPEWQNGHNVSGPDYDWGAIGQTARRAFGAGNDVPVRRYNTGDVASDTLVRVSSGPHTLKIKIHPWADFDMPAAGPVPVGSARMELKKERAGGPGSKATVHMARPINSTEAVNRTHHTTFFTKLFSSGKTRRFLR